MNAKKITAIVLLIFVAVSAVALVYNRPGGNATQTTNTQVEGTKIVAYYSHATQRCPTCLKIEKYSHSVVDSLFANQVKQGKLEFRSINTDDSAYASFLTDYQLASQSLVLVRYKGGVKQKWENLDRIWELVGDEGIFYAYVKDGVERSLKELE
jgi:hypothetical protein